MSVTQEHRAYKGCYVVIGHDQHGHRDYLVGHYISLSRAKKAARNTARRTNGLPTSFSDVFFVYDGKGACLYRITFDDLPKHLHHSDPSLDMPAALPPPRPTYDRLFIKLLLALGAAVLLWQAKVLFDDMELSDRDKAEYAHMGKQFDKGDRGNPACSELDWNRYELMKRSYERELQSPTLPRPRLEYLQDKLRFYEEANYKGPDVFGMLATFVRDELVGIQPNEVVAPDAIYTTNRNHYLARMKAELPLREELGSYVNDQRGPEMPVVTNLDYRQRKRALSLCEQLKDRSRPYIGAFGYLLDGGSGKEVPLDGYEAEAFKKMIAAALARQDEQQANTLYQALIRYQVMYWNLYHDTVQDSITRYRRFLDEQVLDRSTQATALEAYLLKLNPHEYSNEYKDYRDRTLRILRTIMTNE